MIHHPGTSRRDWTVFIIRRNRIRQGRITSGLDYRVGGYTWSSLSPAVHGLGGAVLVMTLGLYPLIYLPVAAALRRADSTLYEVARGLGTGRFAAFRRVVLPQIRPALLGGCLLVTLALLAEFGAFEILRFQTFTTEIFTEFTLGFNAPAASALSLLLVLLSLLALGGEHVVSRGGSGHARTGTLAGARVTRVHRYRLGRPRCRSSAGSRCSPG